MRIHTNGLKNELKEVKQQDYKVSYGTTVISGDDLKNFNPVVNSDLLKSVMKEFYFETPKPIEKGTIINAKQGILVNGVYEYIDYGNYIIKESEYNPNSKTYSYKCYDYMLKTMIDYKKLNTTYPITIKDYIKTICTYCGLEFASYNDDFVNSTKTIKEDYFSNGNYTFRDILDYLAQLVSGWICIDKNNKVEVRYTNETNENFDGDYIRNINVDFTKKYGPVNSVVFSRGDGSDNIYRKDDNSIAQNGLCEIKISDNPFLEDSDRDTFIDGVFNKLKGLEFYILDVDTVGILFLEVGDLYGFQIGIKTGSLKSGVVKSGLRQAQSEQSDIYKCLLLNSEIKTIDGLTETQYVEEPQTSVTDYKTSAPTDNSVKNAIIQTNKNSAEIILKVYKNEVISAINFSPEKITIDTSKLNVEGIATFTNSKLAESGGATINGDNITTGTIAGATVINGDNITTGTINANRLDSKVITTDNFSAQTINADKITAGTLSAAAINLGNGKFKVTTDGKLTSTSGTIAGWSIANNRLYTDNNGIYANGEFYMYPTKGGIVGLNDAFRCKGPAGIAIYNDHANYDKPNDPDYNPDDMKAGISIMGAVGNVTIGNRSSANSVNIRSYCSESTRANPEGRCILLASASNTFLWAGDQIWAEGNGKANSLVKTDAGSSSSRNVKTNIKKFDQTKYDGALSLLKKMDLYEYDYKYNIYKNPHKYGFIIDELEELDEAKDFFEFEEYNATFKDNKIDFSGAMSGEHLKTKNYDSDVLDKYLLTCIKALQDKVEKLENEIKEMRTNE